MSSLLQSVGHRRASTTRTRIVGGRFGWYRFLSSKIFIQYYVLYIVYIAYSRVCRNAQKSCRLTSRIIFLTFQLVTKIGTTIGRSITSNPPTYIHRRRLVCVDGHANKIVVVATTRVVAEVAEEYAFVEEADDDGVDDSDASIADAVSDGTSVVDANDDADADDDPVSDTVSDADPRIANMFAWN